MRASSRSHSLMICVLHHGPKSSRGFACHTPRSIMGTGAHCLSLREDEEFGILGAYGQKFRGTPLRHPAYARRFLSQLSEKFGWAKRDWLRGGVCNFTPTSGFVQLLKINCQNRHGMGHQTSACAQQFQRTNKLTADSLRFANNVHLTERFNHGSKKSIRKARPRIYCCQQCRQSRSRRVLFTVANLI